MEPITLYDRLMAAKPPGLSRNAWTQRAGLSRMAFADIRKRGTAHYETIEKLIDAIGITMADFEAGVRVDEKDPSPAAVRAPAMAFRDDRRPRDVPIMGTAECADLEISEDGHMIHVASMALNSDEVIDHARRPVSLDNRRDVYAIYFQGDSMAPRYESGEMAYVEAKQPPRMMDYVVVQLRAPIGDDEHVVRVLAKRLRRQTPQFLELEQFNPPLIFRVGRDMVKHLHRIKPWDEIATF